VVDTDHPAETAETSHAHAANLRVGLVRLAVAVRVTFYAGERLTALLRRARIERSRAKAEYPITENDPVGCTVVF
jgi:hypothetical protein